MKEITIFTDGASRGNPGPGGWGAVVLETVSDNNLLVIELGGREDVTTNNRMEMTAALYALMHIETSHENSKAFTYTIYTDSAYLLNGVTKWIHGWHKNNWITSTKEDVKNRDLWERIYEVIQGKKIEWTLVPGHSAIPGNERCDVISTTFADNKPTELYKGPFSEYPIKDILDVVISPVTQVRKKKSSSAKAFSYVSFLDGKIETHATWEECEKRVKGKPAKFKKSFSKEDEEQIIKEFLQK